MTSANSPSPMIAGRFIAVVGPSGVGKDSVIDGLCQRDHRLIRARRVITRPTEAGAEDYDGVDEAVFCAKAERGDFALWWHAHGLYYGIPASVHEKLSDGFTVIANLSRSKLSEAAQQFPTLLILELSAPSHILAQRLTGRARETQDDIERRLNRPAPAMPPNVPVIRVANTTTLENCIDTVRAELALPTQ